MSDLFHEKAADDYIIQVAEVMTRASWHTFQVLTKRSDRMRDMLNTKLAVAASARHIWWGVSIEDRKYGLSRIGHLRAANAAVRFLSLEPLLEDIGEINMRGIRWAIIGGESGMRARPFDIAWARSILRQCREQGVACFIKQLGRRAVSGEMPLRLRSFKGNDPAEWPADLRVREYPDLYPRARDE
jgi:protein gp37